MNIRENSPYIVGITGHMDLRDDEIHQLKERVELLFRFLMSRPRLEQSKPLLDELLELLTSPNEKEVNTYELEAYRESLSDWPEFKMTPIVVLTSLAPGADTLVAEVALSLKARELPIDVIAPLPFPKDQYAGATTFKGNKELQDKYHALLARIDGDNVFCVRMQSDLELTEQEFADRCLADRDSADATERHARYRAAGEYVTDYSHLLIAIWDHKHDYETAEGTASIVNARREHLHYDLLPGNRGLNLPHGGPVFHLHTQRLRNQIAPAPGPAARFMHCSFNEPVAESKPNDERAKKLEAINQFNNLTLFSRIARNLENFNQLDKPADNEAVAELNGILGGFEKTLEGNKHAPKLYDRLKRLNTIRRQASVGNSRLNLKHNRTLIFLFWMTLIAASLGHLFIEWHPQSGAHGTTSPAPANTAAPLHSHASTVSNESLKADVDPATITDASKNSEHNESPSSTHSVPSAVPSVNVHITLSNVPLSNHASGADDQHGSGHAKWYWERIVFGLIGVGLATWAILVFVWKRSLHDIEQSHDYRAVAEGLRVQFFWNLAGLGASVPANYMQRQRGELDWIRGVIRAASMPYMRWREEIERLELPEQAQAMQIVVKQWVGQQLKYYEKRGQERHYALHSWHKLGIILALSGLIGIIFTVASSFVDTHDPLSWLQSRWWIGPILTTFFALLAVIDSLIRTQERHRDSFVSRHHAPQLKNETKLWISDVKILIFKLLDRWVLTSETHPSKYVSPTGERNAMLKNSWTYICFACVLTFASTTLATLIALSWSSSPCSTVWTSVLMGIYLVAGALCIAWTEKQFDSEFSYQYSTMVPLFRAARSRLESLVSTLEKQAKSGDFDGFVATREEIRGAFFELGSETLDEHAEWLILHRARPLEPVMAG